MSLLESPSHPQLVVLLPQSLSAGLRCVHHALEGLVRNCVTIEVISLLGTVSFDWLYLPSLLFSLLSRYWEMSFPQGISHLLGVLRDVSIFEMYSGN